MLYRDIGKHTDSESAQSNRNIDGYSHSELYFERIYVAAFANALLGCGCCKCDSAYAFLTGIQNFADRRRNVVPMFGCNLGYDLDWTCLCGFVLCSFVF